MVDNQKVVVILLLITIILSIVSVIVTMGITPIVREKIIKTTVSGHTDSAGNVNLVIAPNPVSGGAG